MLLVRSVLGTVINIWADCTALVVFVGTPLADAILAIFTDSLELIIGGAVQEDTNVALDLLS